MDLLATTTVAQQYPTSPGFISTFKFYNIILFLFPTCNFNLKSSLFYSYFSFYGPLFSLFFFCFCLSSFFLLLSYSEQLSLLFFSQKYFVRLNLINHLVGFIPCLICL